MKKININTWERRAHYEYFMQMDQPQYMMTFDIDVTALVSFVKRHQLSFYLTMIHQVLSVSNQLEAFKYRIVDKEVYLCETIHVLFTDMMKQSDLFKLVYTTYEKDLHAFIKQAKEASDKQHVFIHRDDEVLIDKIYITSFPWASYTQCSHATYLSKYDAVPKISWGQFRWLHGRYIMPLSFSVHHGFIDGIHIAQFLETLQLKLENLEKM